MSSKHHWTVKEFKFTVFCEWVALKDVHGSWRSVWGSSRTAPSSYSDFPAREEIEPQTIEYAPPGKAIVSSRKSPNLEDPKGSAMCSPRFSPMH